MKISTFPQNADDATILAVALRYAVAVLPEDDDADYANIRVLAALDEPMGALASPQLRAAARLALHRFAIALVDDGYFAEADAADGLAYRLRGGLPRNPAND